MTKHTPGPWDYRLRFNAEDKGNPPLGGWYSVTADAANFMVASTELSAEEDEANARLIAAAPDLLSSCVGLLSALEEMIPRFKSFHGNETVEYARAAIAKAKGNQ